MRPSKRAISITMYMNKHKNHGNMYIFMWTAYSWSKQEWWTLCRCIDACSWSRGNKGCHIHRCSMCMRPKGWGVTCVLSRNDIKHVYSIDRQRIGKIYKTRIRAGNGGWHMKRGSIKVMADRMYSGGTYIWSQSHDKQHVHGERPWKTTQINIVSMFIKQRSHGGQHKDNENWSWARVSTSKTTYINHQYWVWKS